MAQLLVGSGDDYSLTPKRTFRRPPTPILFQVDEHRGPKIACGPKIAEGLRVIFSDYGIPFWVCFLSENEGAAEIGVKSIEPFWCM